LYIKLQKDSHIQICFQIVVYDLLEQIYTVADREEIELCAPPPKYLNKYYDQKTVSFNDLSEDLALLRSKVSHLSFPIYCSSMSQKVCGSKFYV
jgi:hypothetical protein